MEWKLTDKFAEHNGMCVVRMEPGEAETRMTVTEEHLNGIGVCQGGALFTLADLAMAAVANPHIAGPDDAAAHGAGVSVDVTMHYLSPARRGEELVCRCRMERDGRLPMMSGDIRTADGRLVANFTGRDYRL